MSYAVGPGDLVLCVNAAPNHLTGEAVPLVVGETYCVGAVMEFACPCGRSDALLDIGVDFAWCQTRFRLLPKPKFKSESEPHRVSAPREKETVSGAQVGGDNPGNMHVREEMRQQLQVLRDAGFIEFLGRGKYRLKHQ